MRPGRGAGGSAAPPGRIPGGTGTPGWPPGANALQLLRVAPRRSWLASPHETESRFTERTQRGAGGFGGEKWLILGTRRRSDCDFRGRKSKSDLGYGQTDMGLPTSRHGFADHPRWLGRHSEMGWPAYRGGIRHRPGGVRPRSEVVYPQTEVGWPVFPCGSGRLPRWVASRSHLALSPSGAGMRMKSPGALAFIFADAVYFLPFPFPRGAGCGVPRKETR